MMDSLPLPAPLVSGQFAANTPSVADKPTREQAMHTAREFESVFLAQFAQSTLGTIETDGPFGGGPAEDIYKSLLAQELGKSLAGSGGFGIADHLYREILKTQEIE